jgi:hypothetical protein
MALIKPRARGKRMVRHRTRLDHETNETLYAYAHFLGESTEYVLNQLIDTVLAKDKDFVQWRGTHPDSFVPQPTGREKGKRRRSTQPNAGSPDRAGDPVSTHMTRAETVPSR